MINFIPTFSSYFEKADIRFAVVEGILWREYQRMIMPVGPVNLDYQISAEGIKQLFKHFPSAMICRWTSPLQISEDNSEFYAVICQSFTSLDQMVSKRRSEINRGLKSCRAEIINPSEFADEAYEVYVNASMKYEKRPVSSESFKKEFLVHKGFEKIIHYWGVFYEEKLIAFAKVLLFENEEANISVARFHPDFLNQYPAYALFHKMNEYYLNNMNFRYVNDGFRSIHHDTNIQDFLIQKFSFKRFPLELHVQYKPQLNVFLKLTYPLRSFFGKIRPQLRALYKLHEISRKKNQVE